MRRKAIAGLIILSLVAGCSSRAEVSYQRADSTTLLVYAGPGSYREILQYAVDNLVSAEIQLADAPADANQRVEAGDADLAFFQEAPQFQASGSLSVITKVGVTPYGLYSSKWANLAEGGKSLPHGSRVVLPGATELFARGLYLLQSARLVKLDRPFGGTTPADLTITQANVVDSLRHLSLQGLYSDEHLREIYQQYDALILDPNQAALLGLDPGQALALEPGPGNPYGQALVAPSRLAGDPRVLELTHALESSEVAQFLKSRRLLPATAAE